MDTTLLFVRHGQSEANTRHIFAGHLDAPLSSLGQKQAEALALYLDAFSISAIYTSDLSRAASTAEPTARRKGLTLQKDSRLREINAGIWEGKTFDALSPRADFAVWLSDIGHAAPEGGETTEALLSRVLGATREIAAKHVGETVLISTHATPIRLLETVWRGLPLSAAKDIPWCGNASVTGVLYKEDGSFDILFRDVNDFLGTHASVLPKNV